MFRSESARTFTYPHKVCMALQATPSITFRAARHPDLGAGRNREQTGKYVARIFEIDLQERRARLDRSDRSIPEFFSTEYTIDTRFSFGRSSPPHSSVEQGRRDPCGVRCATTERGADKMRS